MPNQFLPSIQPLRLSMMLKVRVQRVLAECAVLQLHAFLFGSRAGVNRALSNDACGHVGPLVVFFVSQGGALCDPFLS